MSNSKSKGGIRLGLARLVLFLAILLPFWFMAAGLGYKYGLWDLGTALSTMTVNWGPKLAMGIGGAGIVLTVLGLIKAPRVKIVILSLAAILIAGLVLGRMQGFRMNAQSVPPIHDIQTDWSDPIQFSDEMMELREGANPVLDAPTFGSGDNERLVSEAQAEAYPEIRSLILRAPADVTYSAAYSTLDEMGMEIVTANEEAGVLEATYTSTWYGFKDDVAVRIRPQGEGSQVDVRSVSRVGRSDLGANAARISAILESLSSKLDVADMPS